MTNITKGGKADLYYLSLYDEKELIYILEQENKLRASEGKDPLSLENLKSREVIISKKDNEIDGYSITNLTFNSNNDVSVLIERLNENNKEDMFLRNELFEAAIFVAVEKVQLMKNNNNEIPKIISSSLMVNGKEINFNITAEYIRRHLSDKFNKDAVKQKIEHDEQFKKEREKVEDKVNANTFYNDMGHRFHSNINPDSKEVSVISNDFDQLSLDERLVSLQQENLKSGKKLEDVYEDFAKEKIQVDLSNPDTYSHKDIKELDERHKDLITAASIADHTNEFKIDVENGIAFDKDNKRIDLVEKKEASRKLGNDIELLVSRGYSKEQISNALSKYNVEWKKLSVEDKERIFELYGVTDNNVVNVDERDIDIHNRNEHDLPKRLVKKNPNQAAFASYVVISFISGLSSGIFITLLLMFLRK